MTISGSSSTTNKNIGRHDTTLSRSPRVSKLPFTKRIEFYKLMRYHWSHQMPC